MTEPSKEMLLAWTMQQQQIQWIQIWHVFLLNLLPAT